jgi:hypothetical protein
VSVSGPGSTTAVPLLLRVVANQFSATSFLGGAGPDEVRAMVYQPDSTLVIAANTMVNPAWARIHAYTPTGSNPFTVAYHRYRRWLRPLKNA